jgi:hypothetical protein
MENSMVPALPTLEEIRSYLTTANFAESYVCGDDTVCDMFARRINPEMISDQRSLGENAPKRVWWIEYLEDSNKFVLRCSMFDTNDNPITREQFIEQLTVLWGAERATAHPSSLYTPEAVIQWLPTAENVWTVTYDVSTPTSGCMVAGSLSTIKKVV